MMTNYMNKVFERHNINLPDDINEVILTKVKNQIKYEKELIEYEKQLEEIERIKRLNEERRRNAQLRVNLHPDDQDTPQMPYRHLREPLIPEKPKLQN